MTGHAAVLPANGGDADVHAPSGEPHRQVLTVDGMFCAACAARVEAVLGRVTGVDEASVNFAADAAVVRWQPGVCAAPEALVAAVERLGYRASLPGSPPGQRARTGAPAPGRDLALRLVVAVFFGMWTMLPSIALYLDATSDPVAAHRLAIAAGILSAPVILFSGLPFYRMGIATLRAGLAGTDALVTLGVAGSLLVSLASLAQGRADVFFEVPVALITLQLVARLIDLRLRRGARDAVAGLLETAGSEVLVEDTAGARRTLPLAEVATGDRVRVLAGQRAAVDGRVVQGSASVDRALLTGEAAPVPVTVGDRLFAGEQLLDGSLLVEAQAVAGKRRIDALARQVRRLLAEKPPWQRAADTLARQFLWLTLPLTVLAVLVAHWAGADFVEAAGRALAVLVIACPCALSLAVPLVGLTASRAAARGGAVLRDLNVITGAAEPTTLFVDKTGTLTSGRPAVTAVHPASGLSSQDVLAVAAAAERHSDHPIAHAIVAAAAANSGHGGLPGDAGGHGRASLSGEAGGGARCRVLPGLGLEVEQGGATVRVGSRQWFEHLGLGAPRALAGAALTRVFVARDDTFLGAIDLDDPVRADLRGTLERLAARGLAPVVLSGDGEGPVRRLAGATGLEARWDCTPEGKVACITAARQRGERVAFAGDGINDSTALAAADLGVAVGGATDAARAAAAVTLLHGDVGALPWLLTLLRRARALVRQNLAFAVLYNALAIPLAMAGWVHPAIAALAMAASSVTVMLNAARLSWHRPPGGDDRSREAATA